MISSSSLTSPPFVAHHMVVRRTAVPGGFSEWPGSSPFTAWTFDGWIWLEGYQLDAKGNAVERRAVFVRIAGLKKL
ncbi:hypothetical protein [Micromonospora craniellae]|nr:hypothetical protein [Micromonospora craniellae]QOC91960.1 hypothetical protein ID554_29450 [Micromonospora craniellae]